MVGVAFSPSVVPVTTNIRLRSTKGNGEMPVKSAFISVVGLVALTFTEWFWRPVPTPVGLIILLTVFPPTLVVQVAVGVVNERFGTDVQTASEG